MRYKPLIGLVPSNGQSMVYQIRLPTGKTYVGVTTCALRRRLESHKYRGTRFGRDLRKYWKQIEYRILSRRYMGHWRSDGELARWQVKTGKLPKNDFKTETYYIKTYRTKEFGYNN